MENNNNTVKEKNTVTKALEIFEKGWNKQVILYGPPGTSKTYSSTEIAAIFLAKAEINSNPESDKAKEEKEIINIFNNINNTNNVDRTNNLHKLHKLCEVYLENSDSYKVIQFHPSYSYDDFVRGIVVNTKGNNTIPTYDVKPKIIEEFGSGASADKPRVLVIDEINRAPLGSVLGELIYGLEYRGKSVYTPYVYCENDEEKPLMVSKHLYIIGTMNTADRSIGTMDYAVRRRFAFIPVFPDASAISATWKNQEIGEKAKELYNKLMVNEDNIFSSKYLEDETIDVNDIKIGHTYFMGRPEIKKEDEEEYLKYRIEYQVKPVYEEYIKDGLITRSGMDRFNVIYGSEK